MEVCKPGDAWPLLSSPVDQRLPLTLESLVCASSPSATINVQGSGFAVRTNASVWISFALVLTNPVNFLSFDSWFTGSVGAQGLLSVYWDTNKIAYLDQRVVSPGIQNYAFSLPFRATNGSYTLAFRLDPHDSIDSGITVTNLALGFSGGGDPAYLAISPLVTNLTPVITLTGPTGFSYLVQGSTDLSTWDPVAVVVNTNGSVQFSDPGATNLSHRFYRAVAP